MKIRIGTRGSQLALYQADLTASMLQGDNTESEIVIITTKGDRIQDLSFDKIEGKGFFTKELEDALLAEEIDIAVHSMKDLPTQSPPELCITAVIDRSDPRDCLLIHPQAIDNSRPFDLKAEATIGTSSVRRKAQIQFLINDAHVVNLRGNVPTRIQKLRDGQYDAIILASAGLQRLAINTGDLLLKHIHPREMVPAPAQGAIAVQCLSTNKEIRTKMQAIHNTTITRCTNIERAVLREMDGGCQLPLGVYCLYDEMPTYRVHVAYAKDENVELYKNTYSMSTHHHLVETIVRDLKNL